MIAKILVFLAAFSLIPLQEVTCAEVVSKAVDFFDVPRDTSKKTYYAVWHYKARESHNNWIRFVLSGASKAEYSEFEVKIYDSARNELWVTNTKELEARSKVITPFFFEKEFTIEVSGGPLPKKGQIVIDSIILWKQESRSLQVVGDDQREQIANMPEDDVARNLAMSVAYLQIVDESGIPSDCSGVKVGESHVLTNAHCVQDEGACGRTSLVFGYLSSSPSGKEEFACKKIVCWSSAEEGDLDYALLELDRPASSWPTALISENSVVADLATILIQSPGGAPLVASRYDCRVQQITISPWSEKYLAHTCDTQWGASGSPLFEPESGEVVALHQHGFNVAVSGMEKRNRAIKGDLLARELNACIAKGSR